MYGSFYFYTMSNRIPFQKPYTSAHDLVCLLQSRGLTVTDTSKAEYKGQMELYLRWLEQNEMKPGEESPLGLLL